MHTRCGWRLPVLGCLLPLLFACVVEAQTPSNKVCRVAVAPLRLLDSQLDSKVVRQAFADLLSASLGRHPGIQVVEREELAKILDEKTLGLLNNDTSGSVKVNLAGADFLCVGTYERQTNRVTIAVRLVNAVSSGIAGVFRAEGDWNDLDLVTRKLAGEIASKALGAQSTAIPKATDRSPRANARYLRGLALMGQGDYAAAATEFFAARSIDPKLSDVTVPLAKAFMELGLYADAVLEFNVYLKDTPKGPDAAEATTLLASCDAKLTPELRDLVKQVIAMPKPARKDVKR